MQLLACVLIGQEQTSAKINSVFAIAKLYLNTSIDYTGVSRIY